MMTSSPITTASIPCPTGNRPDLHLENRSAKAFDRKNAASIRSFKTRLAFPGGPTREFLIIDALPGFDDESARILKPGGAGDFSIAPRAKLARQVVEADAALGKGNLGMRDRLLEAPGAGRNSEFERMLLQR